MNRRLNIPGLSRTSVRIYISLMLLYTTLLIVLFSLANNYRSNLIEIRKREIRRQVEISLNVIKPILLELEEGKLDRDAALEQTVTLVRRMTYRSETMNNYIFMSAYDGTMLVQPLEPWLQGTNQLHSKDAYGNYYIQELISAATSPSGEGFVTYYYPPPGATNPGKKLSYVTGIPALRCYIGTGMFFNDIDKLFKDYVFSPLIFIIISMIGLSVLVTLYLRPLFSCFRVLLNSFHTISRKPGEIPPVSLDSFPQNTDEYEILSGYKAMLETLNSSRQSLIRSEERYRQLYEESIGVRIVLSRNGRVADVNTSFCRGMGFSKKEMVGQAFTRFLVPDSRLLFENLLEMAFSHSYSRAEDLDMTDSNGRIRTILFSESFLLPEDGEQVLLTGVEITNRKRAERETQLQKEQLIRADKLSSLGVLVAGMAHEINNPNQFILSSAQLLADIWTDLQPVLDEYRRENGDFLLNSIEYSRQREMIPGYQEGIIEGSRRIEKIVTDLKCFAREETDSAWSKLNINDSLEAALRLCFNLMKNATDHPVIRLEPGLPLIRGNSQKLEQVFINLLQNACQAMEDRKKSIMITSDLEPRSGRIRIVVEDQGRGISPENLSRIFDPFFTTNRTTGGTGLGLSISNTIIKEHFGELHIASVPGTGTRATVLLPRESGSAGTRGEPEGQKTAEEAEPGEDQNDQ